MLRRYKERLTARFSKKLQTERFRRFALGRARLGSGSARLVRAGVLPPRCGLCGWGGVRRRWLGRRGRGLFAWRLWRGRRGGGGTFWCRGRGGVVGRAAPRAQGS